MTDTSRTASSRSTRRSPSDVFFALIATVGTPTNKVLPPIATEAGFPLVGPFTGGGFLRNTDLKNAYTLRGSYDAETGAWIAHLVDERGLNDIAILYQDDSFGLAGLSGVNKALGKRNMMLVPEGPMTDCIDSLQRMLDDEKSERRQLTAL